MGLEAAGAYMQELRSLRRVSRQRIAEMVGISDDRILEFETGRGSMNVPAFLRYSRMLGASIDQVYELIEDETSTVEDGRARAKAWFAVQEAKEAAGEEHAELFEIALERTDGDGAAARAILMEAIERTFGR